MDYTVVRLLVTTPYRRARTLPVEGWWRRLILSSVPTTTSSTHSSEIRWTARATSTFTFALIKNYFINDFRLCVYSADTFRGMCTKCAVAECMHRSTQRRDGTTCVEQLVLIASPHLMFLNADKRNYVTGMCNFTLITPCMSYLLCIDKYTVLPNFFNFRYQALKANFRGLCPEHIVIVAYN